MRKKLFISSILLAFVLVSAFSEIEDVEYEENYEFNEFEFEEQEKISEENFVDYQQNPVLDNEEFDEDADDNVLSDNSFEKTENTLNESEKEVLSSSDENSEENLTFIFRLQIYLRIRCLKFFLCLRFKNLRTFRLLFYGRSIYAHSMRLRNQTNTHNSCYNSFQMFSYFHYFSLLSFNCLHLCIQLHSRALSLEQEYLNQKVYLSIVVTYFIIILSYLSKTSICRHFFQQDMICNYFYGLQIEDI